MSSDRERRAPRQDQNSFPRREQANISGYGNDDRGRSSKDLVRPDTRDSPPRKQQTRDKSAPPARRKPLMTPPSPKYMPQDTAFPTFPTKKEAAKHRSREDHGEHTSHPRASGERSRPVTAESLPNGRVTRPDEAVKSNRQPDKPSMASRPSASDPSRIDSDRSRVQEYESRKSGSNEFRRDLPNSKVHQNDWRVNAGGAHPRQAPENQNFGPVGMPVYDQQHPSDRFDRNGVQNGVPVNITGQRRPIVQTAPTDRADRARGQEPPPHGRQINAAQRQPINPGAPHGFAMARTQINMPHRPATAMERPHPQPGQHVHSPISARDEAHSQRPWVNDRYTHESLGDVYNNYYQGDVIPRPKTSSMIRAAQIEADMPDFDNLGAPPKPAHQRTLTVDQHLDPSATSVPPSTNGSRLRHAGPPLTQPEHANGGYITHQSDMRGQKPPPVEMTGFVFGIPGEATPSQSQGKIRQQRAPIPPTGNPNQMPGPNFDPSAHSGPPPQSAQAAFGHPNSRPGFADMGDPRGIRPGVPQGGSTPTSSRSLPTRSNSDPNAWNDAQQQQSGGQPQLPHQQLQYQQQQQYQRPPPPPQHIKIPQTSPDALPHHPAPVRPGLMQATAPPASGPPVRQYSQTSGRPSTSAPEPPSKEPRASLGERQRSQTVTPAELERLRAKVDANPRDFKTALIYAKNLVEASSVLASEGGRLDAKATAKNRERYILDAHKRIKRLVSAGDAEAMFYLADCYGQGMLGLEVDTKEAFSLYQTAAKSGHPAAAYRTAVCCEMGPEEGGGTRKDAQKAVQWYRRAAQLQDNAAMYKLGVILLKGLLGQQKNIPEAIVWLKKAGERADADNPHALHELALLHEPGSADPVVREKVVADEKYARELYIKAAGLGYKFSQFRLGQAYEYGSLGLPIDARSSIAWYSKAASQGEHGSELALSGW